MAIQSHFGTCALGLKVPSSRPDVDPYFDNIRAASLIRTDLSDHFEKKAGFRSGEEHPFEEVYQAITVKPIERQLLETADRVLIVDDILATGQTVGALLQHLHEVGLPIDTPISVAAPLAIGEWF